MSNVTLSFFSIKAYTNKKEKRNYLHMGDIHGEKLTKVLFNYLNLDPAEYKNDKTKEMVSRFIYFENTKHRLDDRYFYDSIDCIVEAGHYGDAAKIVNINDGGLTHTQKPGEAATKPFGFSIFYKNNEEQAVLAIESIGKNSIICDIKEFIKKAFNYYSNKTKEEQKQGAVYIEILNISPVDYIYKLIDEGEIKNIYLTIEKRRIDDLSEEKPIDSKNKVILYKKPNYINKRKLKSLIVDDSGFNALAELKDDDEEICDIKYDVEIDGQTKSISFSNYRTFRISENITSLVVKSQNGHPTKESLFRAIDARSIEYLKLLNIVGEDCKGEPSNLKNNDCFLDNMTGDDFYA